MGSVLFLNLQLIVNFRETVQALYQTSFSLSCKKCSFNTGFDGSAMKAYMRFTSNRIREIAVGHGIKLALRARLLPLAFLLNQRPEQVPKQQVFFSPCIFGESASFYR